MPQKHNNGKTLLRWRISLLLAFLLLITANFFVGQHGQQVRDARPETYLATAESALNRGDYTTALAQWEKAHQRGPNFPTVHKVHGDIYHRMRNWKQAVTAYEKALQLGSDSSGVRLNLMTALIELKQYRKVAAIGEAFVEEGRQNPHFAHYIATAYFRNKNYPAAIPWFNIALGTARTNPYLLEQLMQSYTRIGKEQRAQEIREKIDEIQRNLQEETPGEQQ
jgi:tetratricopeptide (TPR) repeat protein